MCCFYKWAPKPIQFCILKKLCSGLPQQLPTWRILVYPSSAFKFGKMHTLWMGWGKRLLFERGAAGSDHAVRRVLGKWLLVSGCCKSQGVPMCVLMKDVWAGLCAVARASSCLSFRKSRTPGGLQSGLVLWASRNRPLSCFQLGLFSPARSCSSPRFWGLPTVVCLFAAQPFPYFALDACEALPLSHLAVHHGKRAGFLLRCFWGPFSPSPSPLPYFIMLRRNSGHSLKITPGASLGCWLQWRLSASLVLYSSTWHLILKWYPWSTCRSFSFFLSSLA